MLFLATMIRNNNCPRLEELSLLSAHDLSVDDDLSDTIVDAGYLKQLALHISSYEHLWII